MKKEFENALNELLNLKVSDQESAAKFNQLFKQMVTASMQICGETDYSSLVQQKIDESEKKFGVKMGDSDETDPYKKMRELVRFEMYRETVLNDVEHEVCCTESNLDSAMAKFRSELEKIVPQSQPEVVQSMGYSLYSNFTKFMVNTVMDMVADAKIYQMEEFRPLQLNALGKELRSYVNAIRQQNAKPQKSQTVTNWFTSMMILPCFLFKKLYGVSMAEMFEAPQKIVDQTAHMFNIFDKASHPFSVGSEYMILKEFLDELNLSDSFTVRIKMKKTDDGKILN